MPSGAAHQSTLRSIHITYRSAWFSDELCIFTFVLATAHCNLTSIILVLFSDGDADVIDDGYPFKLNSIRPVLQCRALHVLRLSHARNLEYTEDDIVTMASAWPSMEVLELCKDPICEVETTCGQPLRAIVVFVRHFPGSQGVGDSCQWLGHSAEVAASSVSM